MIAGLLLALAPVQSAPDLRTGIDVVDLTDDYERVWTETQRLPADRRVAHFKQAFARILPGFYDAKRMADFGVTPAQYDEFLGKMLAAYPARRAGIARVAREFDQLARPAVRSFEAAFGPMRGYPPVYLVNSHNEFDGGTRDLVEGNRLMFGADMIDRLYKDRPIQPFFHHELFHMLHGRTFRECEKLWCSLWSEGLATYVAAKLNPGADDQALLLTMPVPLRAAVETNRREAVCAVASRLDSERPEDYTPLFAGGGEPLNARLPRRFGYYVGYLVAQEVGKTRSLKQLALMPTGEVRVAVDTALRKLADCSKSN